MLITAQLAKFAEKTSKKATQAQGTDAIKTSLVLPFFDFLGYDVFDPADVVAKPAVEQLLEPDYILCVENVPVLACCCSSQTISADSNFRLQELYEKSEAKVVVVTDGLNYFFFADLLSPGILDAVPFLKLDLLDNETWSEDTLSYLNALAKETLNLRIFDEERQRQLTNVLQADFAAFLEEPSDVITDFFSRHFVSSVTYDAQRSQVRDLIAEEFKKFINSTRLGISYEDSLSMQFPGDESLSSEALELIIFYRAQLKDVIKPSRLTWRDVQSYSSLLLDDNSRKPICRLSIANPKKLRVELLTDQNTGDWKHLEAIDDAKLIIDGLRTRIQFLLDVSKAAVTATEDTPTTAQPTEPETALLLTEDDVVTDASMTANTLEAEIPDEVSGAIAEVSEIMTETADEVYVFEEDKDAELPKPNKF